MKGYWTESKTYREDNDRLKRLEGSDCPSFVFSINIRVVRFVEEKNMSSGICPVRPVDCSTIDCNEGRESTPPCTWPLGIVESPMIDKFCRPMSEERLLGNTAGTPGKTRDLKNSNEWAARTTSNFEDLHRGNSPERITT